MKTIKCENRMQACWETPIGPMRALIGPKGVHALSFPTPGRKTATWDSPFPDYPVALRKTNVDPLLAEPDIRAHAAALTDFLKPYFKGRQPAAAPRIDWTGYGAFHRAVWEQVRRIPIGQTRTYGEIARRIGRPGAARAVGGSMKRNPLVLIVPCHRVVPAGDPRMNVGGFSGGMNLKRQLLAHEGVFAKASGPAPARSGPQSA